MQEVGVCDRCKSHVEILEVKQWFMKTRVLTESVEKAADEVVWYPDYMKARLVDWARSLDWDWVISRQRVFATPIPVWYCKNCGEVIVAEEEWVPIDPKLENPRMASARSAVEASLFLSVMCLTRGWIARLRARCMLAGLTARIGGGCFPPMCIRRASTSSVLGRIT